MAFGDYASAAVTGATTGGTIGSAIPGVGTSIGSVAGGLLGGIGYGLLGRKKSKETHIEKRKRELVDQMLDSLNGDGPYSDLFSTSKEDFDKNFGDPAREQFKNVTSPQIQQKFIHSGQQRGTGFEDTLTRAGVNLDSMINEGYQNYEQQGQNRKANMMNQILGLSGGAEPEQSYGDAALEGLGGALSDPSFGTKLEDIISAFTKKQASPQGTNNLNDQYDPLKKGYEGQNQYYNPYSGVMGYGQ